MNEHPHPRVSLDALPLIILGAVLWAVSVLYSIHSGIDKVADEFRGLDARRAATLESIAARGRRTEVLARALARKAGVAPADPHAAPHPEAGP